MPEAPDEMVIQEALLEAIQPQPLLVVTVTLAVPPLALVNRLVGEIVKLQAGVIVTRCKLDAPPPGEGLTTPTLAVPVPKMSVAGISAVNCVVLTKVVGRSKPFHCTRELPLKLPPVRLSVKPAALAVTVFGATPVSVGTGLDTTPGCVTVKDLPAMATVPVRALADVLASTV